MFYCHFEYKVPWYNPTNQERYSYLLFTSWQKICCLIMSGNKVSFFLALSVKRTAIFQLKIEGFPVTTIWYPWEIRREKTASEACVWSEFGHCLNKLLFSQLCHCCWFPMSHQIQNNFKEFDSNYLSKQLMVKVQINIGLIILDFT